MAVPRSGNPDRRGRKRGSADFLPVIALMVAGILLSASVFLVLRDYYIGADQRQFQDDAAYYSTSFKSDVERHVTSLAAIHAFVSASHDVNRWEFSAFAHQILPQNSGFKAVLWLPQLAQAQRKAFESNLQRDGLYGLKLRELAATGRLVDAGARAAYLPVAYVEPFESSGDLIGVDLSNTGTYAELFQQARQSGRQVASRPVTQALVEGAKPPMVLVAFPLNRPKAPHGRGSPEGPEGYVLGVLQLQRVVEDAMGARAPIEAAIAYGGTPALFLPGKAGKTAGLKQWLAGAEFHRQVPFQVAGQNFSLLLRSAAHGSPLNRFYAPLGAALLVLALTTLLAQSLAATVLGKREVERAVIARTAELRAVNQALSEEVEQRRAAEAALLLAKEKAETANRAKSAFLSTMSHELRTPLNAIIGFSSLLKDGGDAFKAKGDEYLHEIHGSGVRLLDMINDVLEITQMDAELKDGGDQIFVPDLVEAAIAKAQPLADQAGVTLETALDASLPPVRGDFKRLHRALFHLVSNAVKFGGQGGSVMIAARAGRDGLVLTVSDRGPGMASVAGVTDFFSQLDASLARKHEGVGLGLTYVRRAAYLHDARVEIVSAPGQGTSVALIFPAAPMVAALEVA
ncbi:MAG TPA: CHASE domain-containing protein [Rhizomicrobium sp.]|nr:CHASE domain-containing protein [Rhizomicrobium sp.]